MGRGSEHASAAIAQCAVHRRLRRRDPHLRSATVNSFAAETVANTNFGPTTSPYYPKSLRVLYLLLLSGQFTTCGNKYEHPTQGDRGLGSIEIHFHGAGPN